MENIALTGITTQISTNLFVQSILYNVQINTMA